MAKKTLAQHIIDTHNTAVQLERARCLMAVADEPELPGPMPDEMWESIRNDRDAMMAALRVTVRLTKEGITERIRAAETTANSPQG